MKNLILLGLITLLVSCSSGGKKSVDKLYYRFAQAKYANFDLNVKVNRPTALGILGNRPMVAQTNEGALKQMSSNFWIESPKVLLQNYLQQIFPVKTNQDQFDLTLESQIQRLEKQKSTTYVSIHFRLKNKNKVTVLDKVYAESANSDQATVQSFVTNVKNLISVITSKLEADLKNEI